MLRECQSLSQNNEVDQKRRLRYWQVEQASQDIIDIYKGRITDDPKIKGVLRYYIQAHSVRTMQDDARRLGVSFMSLRSRIAPALSLASSYELSKSILDDLKVKTDPVNEQERIAEFCQKFHISQIPDRAVGIDSTPVAYQALEPMLLKFSDEQWIKHAVTQGKEQGKAVVIRSLMSPEEQFDPLMTYTDAEQYINSSRWERVAQQGTMLVVRTPTKIPGISFRFSYAQPGSIPHRSLQIKSMT